MWLKMSILRTGRTISCDAMNPECGSIDVSRWPPRSWRRFSHRAVARRRRRAADWLQWGGAGRNFMPDATGLASSWPAGGPKRLWTRALGEGHSAILAEGGRIYTMYRPLGAPAGGRRSQEEIVAALDAATGKTVWEFTYPGADRRPRLLAGRRAARDAAHRRQPHLRGEHAQGALRARQGDRQARLVARFHARSTASPSPGRGYACSPLALQRHRSSSPSAGAARGWRRSISRPARWSGRRATSTSRRRRRCSIDVDGQPQLVAFAGDRVAGIDPASGRVSGTRRTRPTGG